ncbi:fibronectin type III domain-containing protein [Aphelenchoides avenae]|nr:fibronectin type III domain-containing protein [Aphelenchus avenae]
MAVFVNTIMPALSDDGALQCCRRQKVPEVCAKTLCNPSNPPGDFDIYDVFERKTNCSKYLKDVAMCLADGRDHSKCCTSEAKDRDENACFGLCRGNAEYDSPWTNYQTCLAINLAAMMACFRRGYESAPTAPREVSVQRVGTADAEISWSPPAANPSAAQRYQVFYVDKDSDENYDDEYEEVLDEKAKEQSVWTEELTALLQDLQPGTRYKVYVVAAGNDDSIRSLPSEAAFFTTTGVSPRVTAYKEVVSAPRGSESAVLACRFSVSGSTPNIRVEWRREGSGDQPLQGDRFTAAHYMSSSVKPREYTATLEIRNVQQHDFGLYRCTIVDDFGDGASEVQLVMSTLSAASRTPPETPIGCCKSRGVQSRCLSMCGAMEPEIKKAIPRPFMPVNCSGEISKVLSCGMPGIDDSGCCLKERMPRVCMYLCDSSIPPNNHMAPICVRHMTTAEKCRTQSVSRRPSAVTGLKAHTSPGTEAVVLKWEASEAAEMYHIYYRRSGAEQWEQKSLTGTTKKIMGADEIVVVAANIYGISQAARLALRDSQWVR